MIFLDKRADSSAVVENIVFTRLNEITKKIGGEINFWRTKAGAEVDFVFRIKGELIPIEVKFSKFEYPKISKSFASFIESFKPRQGVILTKNYWNMVKKNNTKILFVPVYYL